MEVGNVLHILILTPKQGHQGRVLGDSISFLKVLSLVEVGDD